MCFENLRNSLGDMRRKVADRHGYRSEPAFPASVYMVHMADHGPRLAMVESEHVLAIENVVFLLHTDLMVRGLCRWARALPSGADIRQRPGAVERIVPKAQMTLAVFERKTK